MANAAPKETVVQFTDAPSDHSSQEGLVARLPSYKIPLPLWTQLVRFLILFFLSTFLLAFGLLVANARMPRGENWTWLPDIFLEILPKIPWFEAFTNICILVLIANLVFIALKIYLLHRRATGLTRLKIPFNIPLVGPYINTFLFGIMDSGRRPHPIQNTYLIAAIRFLTTYMVMMVYRFVCITVTQLPATDNHCQQWQPIESPLTNMFLTVVTLGGGAIHCGDLLFSGHTVILSLGFCLCWQYGLYTYKYIWAFRLFLTLVLLFAFFAILVSRSHYTDDIVVALYSTVTTYLLLRHDPDGAPWQLQVLIRFWPCPMGSANPEWEAAHLAEMGHAPANPSRPVAAEEVVIETSPSDAPAAPESSHRDQD